jgi:hypothetical protein
MNDFGKRLLALAASLVAASASATTATISTYNRYGDHSVWVTIYDLGKTTHLDYGCVAPNNHRDWRSGNYLWGSFYYVRGEVMSGKSCDGQKLCDTTIQVNPQSSDGGTGHMGGGNLVEIRPNGSNCYWAK